MAERTRDDFNSADAKMSGYYPSPLDVDSDTAIQSNGSALPFHDGRNAGSFAPEVSYPLKQYAAQIQPRNIPKLERAVVAGVLSDPALIAMLGHDTSPAYEHDAPVSHIHDMSRLNSPKSISWASDANPRPGSIYSMGSQSSSVDSFASSVAQVAQVSHTHTTYNLAGIVPEHTMPDIGEIPDLYDADELISSPCFFKHILQADCVEQYRNREDFRDHILSHFGEFGPPGTALCIFCNRKFVDEASPYSCWFEYLDHIRYQHFGNGKVIEDMRPDLVTWAYLRDIGALTPARYAEISEYANENKPSKYPWMRALDWESPREKERKLAKAMREEEANVVRIVERPARSKRVEQSRRQGQSNELANKRQPSQNPWMRPAHFELPREKERGLAKKRRAENKSPQMCREGSSAHQTASGSLKPIFSLPDERNEPGRSSQQQAINPYASLSLFDGPNQQETNSINFASSSAENGIIVKERPSRKQTQERMRRRSLGAENGQPVQGLATNGQDKLPQAKMKGKYWPCLFKDILQTQCNSQVLTNYQKWFDHSKDHIRECHADLSRINPICLFCKEVFYGNSFSERLDESLEHMFHHLEEGAVIGGIRCDTITLEYLNSLGMLSEQQHAELKSSVENKSKENEPCSNSSLYREATEQFPTDQQPALKHTSTGDSINIPATIPQNKTLVRNQRRRKPWDTKSDDYDAREPLLARKPSPSSSATSSNVDWPHSLEAPFASATTTWDGHLQHQLVDADSSSSGTGAGAPNGPTTAASQPVSNATETQPGQSAASSANGTATASNTAQPPPSHPPPNPPPDSTTTTPPTKKTKLRRLLELLSCSEAIMFYIQTFQLCAISFQVACTTMYFNSTQPPLRGTGRFSDSDYLSLLSTSLLQTIALALSLIGMRRRGDENLWIWSVTVASISFMLSVASLVLYFVYTTFGNLFMCLAAVSQLWIWKFVIFGARSGGRKEWAESAASDSRTDLEMQMTTMASIRSTL